MSVKCRWHGIKKLELSALTSSKFVQSSTDKKQTHCFRVVTSVVFYPFVKSNHFSIAKFNCFLNPLSANPTNWSNTQLITFSGDVELNPGPKCKITQTLSICDWNLNSICAHNFAKLFLLRAYVSVHKFDIICLS